MSQDRLRQFPLHLMLIPGLLIVGIYSYLPMAGIIIAFQDFNPALGFFKRQEWVGLENFRYLFQLPQTLRVLWNTMYIATMKIIGGLAVPIVVALLINEMQNRTFKKAVQTVVYLPHFLSWVILGGVLLDVLSPNYGILNKLMGSLGIGKIYFLGDNKWFPFTLIATEIWKEFGWGTIIYLATITSIDPSLYEAAEIDGANRWQQTWHITLTGMRGIIVLMAVLSLGNILNAGFEQVLNLYSPVVYESGDIIDTVVYRMGLLSAQFSVATALGLFKSVVSMILTSLAYYLAYKLTDYRVF